MTGSGETITPTDQGSYLRQGQRDSLRRWTTRAHWCGSRLLGELVGGADQTIPVPACPEPAPLAAALYRLASDNEFWKIVSRGGRKRCPRKIYAERLRSTGCTLVRIVRGISFVGMNESRIGQKS